MNRTTRAAVVTGAFVVVGGVAAAAAFGIGGRSPGGASGTGLPPATTPVTRTTLTQTQQVAGTLSYGASVMVTAGGSGRITWLPELGTRINRGQAVYKSDNRPVPLFYGSLPPYRVLRSGSSGPDVQLVEENLAALGYTGITVDTRYSSATATAVRRWQKDNGLAQTGVFDPAGVVLAPAAIRVASLSAHLGDPANGPLLAYTGTTRIVTVALDVGLQHLVKPSLSATITLPDAQVVKGAVETIGTVATPGDPGRPATIPVTVTVGDQTRLGTLDQAPVTVALVSASVKDVLTVPVAALLALPGGGYGVEVVSGGTRRNVPVQLGMFGDGRVQIAGEGIDVGTSVGIPS
ncbi:peptidoglycan-binding protein [Dactylosporangium siamense]|uniref:Peptidoglycan-binding protein n=1 Tax=Dactylosporangium siamense TaxID=685454 RepID=A0A919UGE7_9ACTN|nr:peptidoglycan-binding protein [Dactylosporangium siamense]GIG50545.1 peptidoglycan-binding protein [Dactylosporangium siamense]